MLNEFSECGKWKIYGSLNPKILIAGHSHAFQMYMAVQRRSKYKNVFAVVTHADFDNPIRQDNNYWNYVVELSKNQPTAISWNGNQHNLHFLVESKLNFNSLGLIQGKNYPYVSVKRIKELFRPTFYELELILSRFSNRENLCLLGTPAPKSKKFIDKNIKSDPFFLQLGQEIGLSPKKIEASSDELRSFMWKITQDLTALSAKTYGCDYLATPNSSCTRNGLLLDEFYADDLTHANEDYAALIMDLLMEKYEI